MHANLLEIAWHENTPIWSIDLSTNRVVTAGGDKVARVWRITSVAPTNAAPSQTGVDTTSRPSPSQPIPSTTVEWLCDLRAHLTTVNVARFALSGLSIATGADQGEIIIWRFVGAGGPLTPFEAIETGGDGAPQPTERWMRHATLRGHVQDVLDLAWAADGHTLVSASVDNSIMVWNVRTPSQAPVIIRAHSNFVQGVAIDPVGKIIASLGNDRSLRLFSRAGDTPWAQIAVSTAITSDSKLFVDDTKFKTFFRRLAWSPDGSVLACPSGLHFPQNNKMFAVHLFARDHWSQPAAQCGGLPKHACAVRFSPILYVLRDSFSPNGNALRSDARSSDGSQSSAKTCEGSARVIGDNAVARQYVGPFQGFPYRMIFAVACVDAVLFYDTEVLSRPFAKVEGLHCAEHTDIAWSMDGLHLMLAAVDGYASIISFSEEELGQRLREDQVPRWLREYSLQREQNSETSALISTLKSNPQVSSKHTSATPKSQQSVVVAPPGASDEPRVVPVTRVAALKSHQKPGGLVQTMLAPIPSNEMPNGHPEATATPEEDIDVQKNELTKRRRIEPQLVVDST